MEKKNHTFLHAVKLWLIWNVLADLSLVIFIVGGYIEMVILGSILGWDKTLEWLLLILLPSLVLPFMIVGLLQWIAFIRRIKHSYWWIFATALGWSMAGILFYLYVFYLSESYALSSGLVFLAGARAGAVIGLPQWLVLRGKVPGAGWWVLGSALGWACTVTAGYFLSQSGMGVMGAVVGLTFMSMITGVVYVYLFTESSQKRFSEEVAFRRADFKPAIPDPPPF